MLKPINVLGGFYTDDTLPFANQDTVNYIPEIAQVSDGARNVAILKTVPANRAITLTSWDTGVTQAHLVVDNTLYIVVDGALFRVHFGINSATMFPVTGTKLSVFGNGRCYMNYMQNGTGYDISIYSGQNGYVYNTTNNTLTQIPDFEGSIACGFLDQYMIGLLPDGSYWFTSDVADPLAFSFFDKYSSEASPDILVGLAVTTREIWVFNQSTIEIFYNAGQQFERNNGAVIQRGCMANNSIQVVNGVPFWLGNDGRVYMANGYQAEAISTPAIESELSKSADLTNCHSYQWESRGHVVYCLTINDGMTFCYDMATQIWHRRESFLSKNSNAWAVVRVGNKQYCIDRNTSNLYLFDWDYYRDDDAFNTLVCKRRTQYYHTNGQWMRCNQLFLVMNTGDVPPNTTSEILLRYSDDSGRNWSNYRKVTLGATGEYAKDIRFYNLGRTSNRLFEIVTSGNSRREIISASMELT
jgi:hypothetical protein